MYLGTCAHPHAAHGNALSSDHDSQHLTSALQRSCKAKFWCCLGLISIVKIAANVCPKLQAYWPSRTGVPLTCMLESLKLELSFFSGFLHYKSTMSSAAASSSKLFAPFLTPACCWTPPGALSWLTVPRSMCNSHSCAHAWPLRGQLKTSPKALKYTCWLSPCITTPAGRDANKALNHR